MEEHDDYAGPRGRFYRWYIRRPGVARWVAAALWGSDFRPLYRHLASLADLAPGTTVVDSACGAGLALEYLDPARDHHYLGIDRSPAMLEAARLVADRRGFTDVKLHQGDVLDLPLADGEASAGLCFNALHCFADPRAALAELARCVARGGVVVGSSLVRESVARADRLLAADDTMGPGGTINDHRDWLSDAGLRNIELETSGAMATFRAHR